MQAEILVYASWTPLPEPQLMGVLAMNYLKGKENYSFEFDTHWLKQKHNPRLDPELPLVRGKSFPLKNGLFGIFSDAAPDRWGRRLMLRQEKMIAQKEGRSVRSLLDLDFLLGVDDAGRMGGLRFKQKTGGQFLTDDRNNQVPPITELRKLENAALTLEADNPAKIDEALAIIFRPGASLGGARPKANVIDPSGALWIAKFPSDSDDRDIGAWEEVTASLARSAGLNIAQTKAVKLGSKHHTYLTRRFDRGENKTRHNYASAMTLLAKKDGESEGTSYLDLAELIISQGGTPKIQLHELWKRIVFSILVSNTDDHLRNHGFLYNFDKRGWDLSPAFDINPVLGAVSLTLSIDEKDCSLSLECAQSVAPYFQIERNDAKEIIKHMLASRKLWRMQAKKVGIKSSEIELMASVFEATR